MAYGTLHSKLTVSLLFIHFPAHGAQSAHFGSPVSSEPGLLPGLEPCPILGLRSSDTPPVPGGCLGGLLCPTFVGSNI